MHLLNALAQTPDPRQIKWVYIWGGILIGVVLVCFLIYSAFKRWMNDTGVSESPGFTLSDMRKLRDEGKISAEEYEQTRAKMVAAARKMTEQIPDVKPRRTPLSPDARGDPPGG